MASMFERSAGASIAGPPVMRTGATVFFAALIGTAVATEAS